MPTSLWNYVSDIILNKVLAEVLTDSPVVRIQHFHKWQGPGSVPSRGAKIPQVVWPGQKSPAWLGTARPDGSRYTVHTLEKAIVPFLLVI